MSTDHTHLPCIDWTGDLVALIERWLPVPPDRVPALASFAAPVVARAGDTLFEAGAPADDCVLLATGLVRAYYVHVAAERALEVNLRLISAPAAALPYLAFSQAHPADETLQALTDVRGYRIRLRALCNAHSDAFTESVRRVLAETHAEALDNRLRMLQHQRASERYAHFLRTMPEVVIRDTPGYHVASYLGISPESLSRVRTRAARVLACRYSRQS